MVEDDAPIEYTLVEKLDAANRQINTAIWLWFNDADIVSINTLIGAAHGIVDDLLHERQRRRAQPFDETPEGISPKKWREIVKSARVFAKHAREDPDETYPYADVQTAFLIYFVVISLHSLAKKSAEAHTLRSLFLAYFVFLYPEAFEPDIVTEANELFDIEGIKDLPRRELFEKFCREDLSDLRVLPRFHSGNPPESEKP